MTGTEASCTPLWHDTANRIRWHRTQIAKLTQDDYAAEIGTKRPAFSLWEAGSHRLSLDGALALRRRWGLTLDFLYFGDEGGMPLPLLTAWQTRQDTPADPQVLPAQER